MNQISIVDAIFNLYVAYKTGAETFYFHKCYFSYQNSLMDN